jgi:ATP-dependent Clp protease adaptor protein ClpS
MQDMMQAPAVAQPKPGVKPAPQTRPQRPWAVILHNDNINGFDFVIRTLQKVLHYGFWRSLKLAVQAHCSGRAIVWTGFREHAELKAEQIQSCGPDPGMLHRGALPLHASVEQLPE